MPDQARFLDFMDMIDGGGRGRMGDKFEDGGIFSALANLIATPYGSEDEERRARREAAYRAAGLLAPEETEAAAPAAAPAVTRGGSDISGLRPQLRPDNFMTEAQKEQVVMNQPVGQGYPDMSMPAIAGYTTPAPAPVTSDPRGFAPNTQPSMLTEAQKEAMVMAQPVVPMGNIDVRFGAPATPSPMLDQRQQAPSPDEARALQAISDNNMMSQFMNLPPYQQRAMIDTMLQRGY